MNVKRGEKKPRPVWTVKVDVVQAELLGVGNVPLQVVHERPGRVALHVDAVQLNGCA